MATDDGRVTEENNASLWQKLMELRELEKSPLGRYPGWIVKGNLSYQVIQQADQSVAFIPKTTENLYESTSF
jgi:hypothetical protein